MPTQHSRRANSFVHAWCTPAALWIAAGLVSLGAVAPAAAAMSSDGAASGATSGAPAESGAASPAPRNPQSEAGADLGEIVVTARRREESLITTPVAISVVSGAALLQQDITTQYDLATATPGLTVATLGTQTRGSGVFAIRGQGGLSGVATYFGEVPGFGAPPFGAPFYDMDSVQVLKGPQGTLFGQVTTGGAVLLSPQMPTDEFGGYIDTKIGDYNRHDLEFAVGGPLLGLGDVLTFRLAGQINHDGGFSTNIYNGNTEDGLDNESYRAILQFKPTDWLKNTTIGVLEYNEDSQAGQVPTLVMPYGNASTGNLQPMPASIAALAGISCPGGVCPTWLQGEQQALAAQAGRSPYTVDENNDSGPRFNLRHYGMINTTTAEVNKYLTLKNIASYQATDQLGTSYQAVDATSLPLLEVMQPTSPGSREITEELQAQGSLLDDRIHLTGGAFYDRSYTPYYQGVDYIEYGGFPASVPLPSAAFCAGLGARNEYDNGTCHLYYGAISELSKTNANDKALYFQTDIKITDKLSLTAGYRSTWSYRFQSTADLTSTSADLVNGTIPSQVQSIPAMNPFLLPSGEIQSLPAADQNSAQANFHKGTYTFALDYQFNNNLMVYATTREGYQPGGFNGNAPPGHALYGPENVTDYEIGAKAFQNFGNFHVLSSVDVFWDNYNDIQRGITQTVLVNGVNQLFSYTGNVAKARIRGLDLDTTLGYEKWIDVTLRYTLTDPSISQFPNTGQYAPYIPATADLTQDLLAYVIKQQWAIIPSFKLAGLIGNAPDLVFSGNLYHQSRFAQDEPNIGIDSGNIVPGYTLLDLRLDWFNIGTNLSLAAAVKNVANFGGEIAGHDLQTTIGLSQEIVSPPRTFYIELNYKL
jgi:iron complex outermembrane recepter protein